MNNPDWLGNASLDELKSGYVETAEQYTCLCCGQSFEKGIIYPEDGVLYDAGKYTRRHIEREHQSVFAHLIGLDKSVTGLSELQNKLLALFYLGKSDADVQQELGIGSTSTVRSHRFLLKEKERQAKVFQAIMELLRDRQKPAAADAAPPMAGGTEDRPRRTGSEQDKVLNKYFPHGTAGPLQSISMKEKHKLIVLGEIANRFLPGRMYTEKEVNQVLAAAFADYAALRRYLVDYGFLSRLPDGSQYWRELAAGKQEESSMDRKELKRLAQETKADAGIYQIKNNRNGKVLVESTRNLKTINGQEFQLSLGLHKNKALQQEWNECGKEAFTFEVLAILDKEKMAPLDERDALAKLKEQWLQQLQPFGDHGYNPIREQE